MPPSRATTGKQDPEFCRVERIQSRMEGNVTLVIIQLLSVGRDLHRGTVSHKPNLMVRYLAAGIE